MIFPGKIGRVLFLLIANLDGDLIIGDTELGQYPYSTGMPLLTSLDGLNNLVAKQGIFSCVANIPLLRFQDWKTWL